MFGVPIAHAVATTRIEAHLLTLPGESHPLPTLSPLSVMKVPGFNVLAITVHGSMVACDLGLAILFWDIVADTCALVEVHDWTPVRPNSQFTLTVASNKLNALVPESNDASNKTHRQRPLSRQSIPLHSRTTSVDTTPKAPSAIVRVNGARSTPIPLRPNRARSSTPRRRRSRFLPQIRRQARSHSTHSPLLRGRAPSMSLPLHPIHVHPNPPPMRHLLHPLLRRPRDGG